MAPIIVQAATATVRGYGAIRATCRIALGHRVDTASSIAAVTIANVTEARRPKPAVHVAVVIHRSHKVANA